jgi:uncharacterized RDD family membrane protein YckC
MSSNESSSRGSTDTAERTVQVIGFGPRLIAMIIDGILVFFFGMLLAAAVGTVLIVLEWYVPSESLPVNVMTILSGLAVSVLYFCGSWVNSGRTLGKMVVGNQVVRADGTPLTWGKALLRYLGYIVSAIALSIGFLWVAFDKKRQGWHDKLAGTVVVDIDTKFSPDDRVKLAPKDPKPDWIWLVVWVVAAIAMPGALVASLLLLGPFIFGLITNLVRGG